MLFRSREGLYDGSASGHLIRAIWRAPHPERQFAPSRNADAPWALLLELRVRNDLLAKPHRGGSAR